MWITEIVYHIIKIFAKKRVLFILCLKSLTPTPLLSKGRGTVGNKYFIRTDAINRVSNIIFMDYNKAKELLKLQQDAQKIQNELSNIHIEAESDGFVVTIDGQMKAIKVEIEDTSLLTDKTRLEKAALEAINKGLKKSQEIAADKMKGVMGSMGLNLP